MSNVTPVILCGGSGSRLWPKSRPEQPKPFQQLVGERTLFEQTLTRTQLDGDQGAMVVAGARHLELIEAQSADGTIREIIIEPDAKNTAPAIALAAARLDPDTIMLVCPSDHHISDENAFREVVRKAARLAESGWLVTLGIDPTGPETGFGYIERGEELGQGSYEVRRFVEKPDLSTAQSFVKRGTFSWNSGIFLFKAGTFWAELQAHRPEMAKSIEMSVAKGESRAHQFHPAGEPFEQITGESIDYAVMENAKKVAVIPVSMGWSDIGNWRALHEAQESDELGNFSNGPAELVDCKGVFTDSDGPRVSVIGLEDVIVVVDGDEILVTASSHVQQVGQLRGAKGQ